MTTEETTVTGGDQVTVHYVGTIFDTEEVFDSSRERGEPITFVADSGQMIRGFNDAVVGMTVGETKEVVVAPSDGYGEIRPEAKTEFLRTQFPEELELTEGMPVPMRAPTGQVLYGHITEIGEESVTVDLNHPLAGKVIKFDIEVVSITPAPEASEE